MIMVYKITLVTHNIYFDFSIHAYDDVVERTLLINTFFQKLYSPLVVF